MTKCVARSGVTSTVPILILTALAREDEVVRGLEMGADDYLTKPFGVREMLARVNALARRIQSETPRSIIQIGDLRIDSDRRAVMLRDGRIDLTPTEFRLLSTLARNRGRVVAARTLIREAQDYDCAEREAQEIVKVHVSHLRSKLESDPEESALHCERSRVWIRPGRSLRRWFTDGECLTYF